MCADTVVRIQTRKTVYDEINSLALCSYDKEGYTSEILGVRKESGPIKTIIWSETNTVALTKIYMQSRWFGLPLLSSTFIRCGNMHLYTLVASAMTEDQ